MSPKARKTFVANLWVTRVEAARDLINEVNGSYNRFDQEDGFVDRKERNLLPTKWKHKSSRRREGKTLLLDRTRFNQYPCKEEREGKRNSI